MTAQYCCANEGRRAAVRTARDEHGQPFLNGIDFVEVGLGEPVTLEVHFIHPLPGQPGAVPAPPVGPLTVDNLVIEGGIRIRNVRPKSVAAAGDTLSVEVNTSGDFSIYTLRVVRSRTDDPHPPDGFDPALSQIEFSFKVACPSDFDCLAATPLAVPALAEPSINYLAKDYGTFRQLMLDRLSVVMPDWKERTPADMQMALIELMAYVGDSLSYYQDAVATEAYLGTARKRVSVRRHARLLDYAIHEGSNARAWVCLTADKNSPADGVTVPSGTPVLTGAARSGTTTGHTGVADVLEPEAPAVFETMHGVTLAADRNTIRFHTWSDQACTLSRGATAATLLDRPDRTSGSPALLSGGDVLVFEEILSPLTGLASDADPAHRWAVRLTGATPSLDPLTNTPVLEIEWGEEDALPFALCVSTVVTDSSGQQILIEPTVGRGNVVLTDHGSTIRDEPLVPPAVPAEGNYRPALARTGLTFQGPLSPTSATAAMQYDVRDALPVIMLSGDGGTWTARYDLLESDAFSRHFIVEMQSNGVATIRFGDGITGRRPSPGATFTASYRIGTGTRGNVGPDVLQRLAQAEHGVSGVRNPIAATSGRDPEALEQIRQFAPQAFRTQERAVTEADYAAMTERHGEVQKAAANFRWTGSWYTAFVTVDRTAGRSVETPFKTDIRGFLEPYRIAGYDLEVTGPVFVPLDLMLSVCVAPGYFQGDVKRSLLETFSSHDRPDATRGFFHPDNFTFGQSLYLSQIYEAAMQVAGVASVNVTRFQRWGKSANHELERGVLTAAPLEILQVANDPSFPENGRFGLILAGGL